MCSFISLLVQILEDQCQNGLLDEMMIGISMICSISNLKIQITFLTITFVLIFHLQVVQCASIYVHGELHITFMLQPCHF